MKQMTVDDLFDILRRPTINGITRAEMEGIVRMHQNHQLAGFDITCTGGWCRLKVTLLSGVTITASLDVWP